jgi:hypothetical protein
MTRQIRGLIRFSMGLMVGLALMTSCVGDQAPEAEVGHLRLSLESTSDSGVLYRLRFAVFDILNVVGGPGATSVSSEDYPADDPAIFVAFPNGRYQVTLEDGWSVEHSANGLPFTPIQAELVSINPVWVDVVANQRTDVTFAFEIDADTIIFGSGAIQLDFDVDEVIPLTVFVTDLQLLANLGGIDNADGWCQDEAYRANLTGTFRAWLSTSSYSPATDWGLDRGNYRFVRPDGTELAESWEDLTDGELTFSPSLKADGTSVGGTDPAEFTVWTGTEPDGTAFAGENCDAWTTGNPAQQTQVGIAASTAQWTNSGVVDCNTGGQFVPHRWYCFEQAPTAQP